MLHNSLPDVSRETSQKIAEYISLLQKWNAAINLISKEDMEEIYSRHINDCISLKNILKKHSPSHVIDIGSGNGMPGIILSLCAPDYRITLNDADQRKCAFLREVIAKLGLSAKVAGARIEHVDITEYDVVITRAFRSISDMLRLLEGKLSGKTLYLMKGEKMAEEIMQAKVNWDFSEHTHKLSLKSYIVRLDNITRKHG